MRILERLSEFVPSELIVILTSALPVLELKASIPMGIGVFQLNPWLTLMLAVFGALIPAPFLLKYIRPILLFMGKNRFFEPFTKWVVKRSMKRSGTIKKFSLIGLFIFVSAPLPTTGVWTGCIIASLLGLKFYSAFITIILGTIVCGLIVLVLSSPII